MLYSANYHYNLLDQIDQANVSQSVVNSDGSTSAGTDNYGYTYGTGAGDNTNTAQSLTQVTDNGSVTNTYAFDGVGNFIGTSLGSANPLNQYSNLTYNGRGDVTNDGRYSYTYDANDRMISITPVNPQPGSYQLFYGYDSQGRRLWKDVYAWDNFTGAWGWTYPYSRHYVYDGNNLVAELDENNNLLQQYTWSPNGQLLAVTNYPEGCSSTTYLAVIDASGNTAMLVNTTDGSVAASYKYDPYGNLLSASGPDQFICSFLGKGWYYDIEAPTIFHADLRDGKNNVWYERDPAGEIAGGANLNAVVAGDPINLSDTSGLAPTDSTPQIITIQIPEDAWNAHPIHLDKPAYRTFGGVRYMALQISSEPEGGGSAFFSNVGRGLRDFTYGWAIRPFGVKFMGSRERQNYAAVVFLRSTGDAGKDLLLQAQWTNNQFTAVATQTIEENKYAEIVEFGIPVLAETGGGLLQLRSAVQDVQTATGGIGPVTPPHESQLGHNFSGNQAAPIKGPGGTTVREGVMSVVPRPGMDVREIAASNGRLVKVYGQEFSSSTTNGHAAAIVRKATEMAKSGDYEYVLMQRSWRTATNRAADGSDGRLIPDVIGVRTNGKVDAFEVMSRNDLRDTLLAKLNRGMNSLPLDRQGNIDVIQP
jgi:hypothetical protein